MKKLFYASIMALAAGIAQADNFYYFVDPQQLVYGEVQGVFVSPAKVTSSPAKGTHLQYSSAQASIYLSPIVVTNHSLTLELGYWLTNVHWPHNPRFKQSLNQIAVSSLAYVNTSWDKWRWIFRAGLTVDAQSFDPGKDGVGFGMITGRRAVTDHGGIHIGAYGYGGMHHGYALPIIGFDWRTERWLWVGVFPMEISATYFFTEHWCAKAEYTTFGGPYQYPYRIHKGIGKFRGGIYELFSTGLDLTLEYRWTDKIKARIGGGYNFGGWIEVMDRHGGDSKNFDFNPAPYGLFVLNGNY